MAESNVKVNFGPRQYRDGTTEDHGTKRERRGSFFQDIFAHDGKKQVGSLNMTFHQNDDYQRPKIEFPGSTVNDVGTRMFKTPTAHVNRIDNTTFDGWNKGVKGVGTALMGAAEHVAKANEAMKMTLEPSPQQFTRIDPNASYMNQLKAKFDNQVRKNITQSKLVDPTGFYQHTGYDYDPDQKAFRALEAQHTAKVANFTQQETDDLVQKRMAKTPLMSKFL